MFVTMSILHLLSLIELKKKKEEETFLSSLQDFSSLGLLES